MYRRILVPLDGTRFGDHALPHAVDIAVRTGALLELVHVHQHHEHEPDLVALTPYQFQHITRMDAEVDQASQSAERSYLEQRAAEIEIRHGIRVVTRVLAGRTADAVAAEAQDIVADLIVLATHARSGMARLRLGHLAHELVCGLNVPALCVRVPAEDAPLETRAMRRVLIPLDGSSFSEQILEPVVPLVAALGARATLLHILSPRPMVGSGLKERRLISTRQQAIEYLRCVAQRHAGRMPEPVLTALEDSQPANVIASLLSLGEYDAVAMATHGRSGLSRLIMGSVAEEVLQHASRPVLLYRPRLEPLPSTEYADAFRIYGE
jgi:nucleotide-binding universal stress UspA family protein